MTAAINEKLLEDRLGTLEAARSWSPRVVSRLQALIRSGEVLSRQSDQIRRRQGHVRGGGDRPFPPRHGPWAVRDELDAALFAVRLRDRELQHNEQVARSSALQSVPDRPRGQARRLHRRYLHRLTA